MADGKPKILLVEDDPFMTTLLSQELAKQGFEVIYASTGEDAIAKFSDAKPDGMVLDILLPRKSGLEALREIRSLPGGADTPALMLSNMEDPIYVKEAEELHVKGYLIKANVDLSDITAKVKEMLKP